MEFKTYRRLLINNKILIINKCHLYKFFYYKLYLWSYRAFGKSDLPELNALLILSLFSFSNLLTFAIILGYIFELDFIEIVYLNKFYLLIALGLNLLINYYILFFRDKHKISISQFEKENVQVIKKYTFFTYTYFIGSIILLIGVIIIAR